ncbi:MAG: endonuclease domain-containing protein [Acaryochloris sp. RU_4_1]|nr:endonuclease domain-containing protein [Acaryochloris sp. RU_4_1]NJR54497.1 endonuclease domain-containing protein [Acaryochloris sp. CRU_2_0]
MDKTHNRIRGTTPEIERAARHLRHRLTLAEATLWQALKNRQLGGLRWRCQHPMGRFIVDFYCPSCRLIVEVDGEIHYQQQEYDCARTEHLQNYGYTVIRFSNEAVETNLEAVLATIYGQCHSNRMDLPPILGGWGG